MKFRMFFSILIPLLSFCSMISAEVLPCMDIPIKLDNHLNCFAEEQKANHLLMVSKGVEMDVCEGSITRVDFLFDYYNMNLDIPQTRTLLMNVVSAFLKEFNALADIKKEFKDCTLTADNLAITIRMRSDDSCFIFPKLGNIAYVTMVDGMISYGTLNSQTFLLQNLWLESYPNALKIVTPSTAS